MHSVVFNRIPKNFSLLIDFVLFRIFFFLFFWVYILIVFSLFSFSISSKLFNRWVSASTWLPSSIIDIQCAKMDIYFIKLSHFYWKIPYFSFLRAETTHRQRRVADKKMVGGNWRALDSSCGQNEREKGLMKRKSFYCDRKWHFGLFFFLFY